MSSISTATRAASEGDLHAINEYLEGGGDVNARNLFQSQLLHIAAREGHLEVAVALIEAGAQLNSLDYGGMRRTALHWACQQGHLKMVEMLVDRGADTKAQGKAWSKLVQGQKCGKMIDTEAPYGESPANLCKNDTLKVALERPAWSPDIHRSFPERFRAATRTLLLLSNSRVEAAADAPEEAAALPVCEEEGCESSDLPPADGDRGGKWWLPEDILLSIIGLMAYPVSSWVREGDFAPAEQVLR